MIMQSLSSVLLSWNIGFSDSNSRYNRAEYCEVFYDYQVRYNSTFYLFALNTCYKRYSVAITTIQPYSDF